MKTKIAAVALSALLLLTAAAQQYTGTVVDDQGRPVSGATVDCYCYQSPAGFGYWDREPKLQQTTVTDGKGAFAVSASADTTLVVVKKAGLATAWKTWGDTIPASTNPIVLTAPAALSGVVVDDGGQPVPDAEVWVAGANIGNEYDTASQLNDLFGGPAKSCFSARTGADGKFRIENFPADGRAGLAVSKAGMARHPIGGELGGEHDCQPGQDLKLVVGPAGSVEGKVMVAETGQPLGGVEIKMDQFGAGVFGYDYYEAVKTRADGTFLVPDVQPGKHCIRASISGGTIPDWVFVPEESQLFTVTAGETVSNVVIHFSKGALVEVTVVVTNTLTPIANAAVSSFGSSAFTDDKGVALVRSLTGTNWFSATKQDWSPQQTKADIEAGHPGHVQIEMIPPPHITGIVRDSAGVPAPGVLVSFHPGRYPMAPLYGETNTDENGRYEMVIRQDSHLFEGWMGSIDPISIIMARDLKRNLATILELGDTNSDPFNQKIEPIPTNIDLNLQPGITISGSVKDTEGAPVTNATLDFSIVVANQFVGVNPLSTNVNAQGSFAISAIPQGRDSFLRIAAKGYGAGGGMLKAGDSKTNHYEFPAFVLKRADRVLAGQVLSRDGKAVAGTTVNIWGQGQPAERSAKSDGEGHFIFNGVCAGEIKVSARHGNNNNQEQGDVLAQGGDTNVVVRLGIYANDNKYLSPPLTTTGTVRDPSGTASAGVKVSLFPVNGRPVESVTGAGGRYEINWQARLTGEETHWLLARDLKHGLAAIQQVDVKTTNLDLTLQDGLTLSTEVSDSNGEPMTNATAMVTLWQGNRGYGIESQPLKADEQGRFSIGGLPQGQKYWVRVEAPGSTSATLDAEADETKTNFLELPPVVLTPARQIVNRPAANNNRAVFRSVAVTTSGTVFDPSGTPAPGAFVAMLPSGGLNSPSRSDVSGKYVLQWQTMFVRTNKAEIFARDPEHNWAVTVEMDAKTTNLDLHLQPGLTLSGVVHDSDGNVVTNAVVQLVPFPPADTRSGVYQKQPTNTIVEGLYSFSAFPEGIYSISAFPQGAPYFVRVDADGFGSKSILLSASDTKIRQLKLPIIVLNFANQQVAGKVIGLDGKPCWGAEVTVSGDGQPLGRITHSDSNGNFVVKNVCKGSLELRAMLSASATNPRYLVGLEQAHGGDKDVVVKLGVSHPGVTARPLPVKKQTSTWSGTHRVAAIIFISLAGVAGIAGGAFWLTRKRG